MSAVERLAAALRGFRVASMSGVELGVIEDSATDGAQHILRRDPALAAAIELGLAWAEAEAAATGEWMLAALSGWLTDDGSRWTAHALSAGGLEIISEENAVPAEALRSLSKKLRVPA